MTDAKPRFEIMLDTMFRFYPKWKGFHALFQKADFGRTAFVLACEKLTRETVIEVVETILVRFSGTTPSLNIGDVLVMAAIDNNSSLDGLYFIMRRHPATMLSMLRDQQQGSTTTKVTAKTIPLLPKNKGNIRNGDMHSINDKNCNENTDDDGTDDHNINTNTDTDTNTKTNNANDIASNKLSSANNAIVLRRSTWKRKRN